jgi:hypothetical protein
MQDTFSNVNIYDIKYHLTVLFLSLCVIKYLGIVRTDLDLR